MAGAPGQKTFAPSPTRSLRPASYPVGPHRRDQHRPRQRSHGCLIPSFRASERSPEIHNPDRQGFERASHNPKSCGYGFHPSLRRTSSGFARPESRNAWTMSSCGANGTFATCSIVSKILQRRSHALIAEQRCASYAPSTLLAVSLPSRFWRFAPSIRPDLISDRDRTFRLRCCGW
jgi:hypothetical protein